MMETGLIFSGEYVHQLDEKGRFKLPKRMEEIFTEDMGTKCVLMKMPEKCLALYPYKFWYEEYGKYLSSVRAKMPGRERHRRFTRMISSSSLETKVGAQGRVALTENQAEYMGVRAGENLVVVGAGERIELWSEEAWKRQQAEDMADFGSLIEDVSEEMDRFVSREGEVEGN
jgi:MraZ protein